MVELTPAMLEALDSRGPGPLPVLDPRTNKSYVILAAEVFEQMRLALDEKFDIRGAYPLMDEMAAKAGWDDPAMDIYGDFAPKQQ